MGIREAVANRIVYFCYERNISFHSLARSSAIPPTTLKNIISGVSANPGIVTIKKICDGLDISIIEFFDTEAFRGLEQEIR